MNASEIILPFESNRYSFQMTLFFRRMVLIRESGYFPGDYGQGR